MRSRRAGARASLALTFVLLLTTRVAAQDTRPNIVILLADDLGIGDLGCYGQTRIHTPRIDALATEGVLASHAYASAPVCAPSRCSLLTGMHSGHCSVDHNDEPNVPLGLSDVAISEVLAREGYRTGIVGKWGLGGETDDRAPFALASLPTEFGFEHVYAVLDQELAQDHFPDRIFGNDGWQPIAPNADGARGAWDADLFAEDALAFVDAPDPRPFFLYFASTLPHRELDPPLPGHADTDWPAAERAYAAMVERFDADVGRIVDRVDALDRPTIVIIASDNGPVTLDGHDTAFFDSAAGRRGQKRDLYEGGLRVPLIVRWRGQLTPRAIDAQVTLYDLFPTLAELVHAEPPSPMDGVSITEWLRGDRSDTAHEHLFFEVNEAHGGTEPITRFALYEGPLTLIEREGNVLELYDLDSDPGQRTDLASTRAADVERLHAVRMAQTGLIRRSIPTLDVRGETALLPALDERTFAPVLELLVSPLSDHLQVAIESPLVPRPVVTAHGGVAVSETAFGLASGDYLTAPAHPGLSFGDASFTLEARVRLDHLAADATTREGRRYLALSKPTGTPDELLDWGVLVQAGDLAAATGHELAMVFADPEIGGHGTWTIASHLTITDGEWHTVAFRFDAAARIATFVLDDQRESLPVVDLGHVRSDAPLVIGAHHDVRGTFDGWLDGALADFRLSRGVVPDDALRVSADEPTFDFELDLGNIDLGAPEVSRTFYLVNAGVAPTLAMDVDGSFEPSDDRVSVDFVATRTVTNRVPMTIRVRPTRAGAFTVTAHVRATASHLGLALRGPTGFTIHGNVVGATPDESNQIPMVVAGVAVLLALCFAAWRIFNARSGSPRA